MELKERWGSVKVLVVAIACGIGACLCAYAIRRRDDGAGAVDRLRRAIQDSSLSANARAGMIDILNDGRLQPSQFLADERSAITTYPGSASS